MRATQGPHGTHAHDLRPVRNRPAKGTISLICGAYLQRNVVFRKALGTPIDPTNTISNGRTRPLTAP